MIVSVASGKGGTGKTLFSVNLFSHLRKNKKDVLLVDLDVEEPNCSYLMDINSLNKEKVLISFPNIDDAKCVRCNVCSKVCNFGAVVVLPDRIYIDENLCHSCNRCKFNCTSKAISDVYCEIGDIDYSNRADNKELVFVKGTLKEGITHSNSLISKVKKFVDDNLNYENNKMIIQDCPPGVSCSLTEAVKGSDVVILVTEPNPFGLHDLKLAVETIRKMKLELFVLINKSDENDFIIEDYCGKEHAEIIGKIPYSEEVSSLYAEGKSSGSIEWYADIIRSISDKLLSQKIWSRQ